MLSMTHDQREEPFTQGLGYGGVDLANSRVRFRHKADRHALLVQMYPNIVPVGIVTQASKPERQASQAGFVAQKRLARGLRLNHPEAAALTRVDREALMRALEALPVEYREAIVMREMEGLSYKEIASAAGVPIGTVMSRLARARDRLRLSLTGKSSEPGSARPLRQTR